MVALSRYKALPRNATHEAMPHAVGWVNRKRNPPFAVYVFGRLCFTHSTRYMCDMSKMLGIIHDWSHQGEKRMKKWIIDNVIEFNKISNRKYQNNECHTYTVFSQFKDWYYIPSINKFGPSKFIGYEKTTLDNYKGNGSGGKTNRILQQYFLKLEKNKYQKLYDILFSKISSFAEEIHKKLSRKIDRDDHYGGCIYVPKECNLREVENKLGIDSHEELIPNLMGSEGKITKVLVNKYERNPRLRVKAIEIH